MNHMLLEHFLFCGCLACILIQFSLIILLSVSVAFDVADHCLLFKKPFSIWIVGQ